MEVFATEGVSIRYCLSSCVVGGPQPYIWFWDLRFSPLKYKKAKVANAKLEGLLKTALSPGWILVGIREDTRGGTSYYWSKLLAYDLKRRVFHETWSANRRSSVLETPELRKATHRILSNGLCHFFQPTKINTDVRILGINHQSCMYTHANDTNR